VDGLMRTKVNTPRRRKDTSETVTAAEPARLRAPYARGLRVVVREELGSSD
jgi:hypothetical protein